jgi:hypothetical protein
MPDLSKRFDQVRVTASAEGVLTRDANGRTIEGIVAVNRAVRPSQPPIVKLVMSNGTFDVVGVRTFLAMSRSEKDAPNRSSGWNFGQARWRNFLSPHHRDRCRPRNRARR